MFHVKHSRREMKKELRKKIQIVVRSINDRSRHMCINGLYFNKNNFNFELTTDCIWLRDSANNRIMMCIEYEDIKEIVVNYNVITFEKRA